MKGFVAKTLCLFACGILPISAAVAQEGCPVFTGVIITKYFYPAAPSSPHISFCQTVTDRWSASYGPPHCPGKTDSYTYSEVAYPASATAASTGCHGTTSYSG
jgi:hypothetical protein